MNYDFDRVVDRKCTNDLKWHSKAVESYLNCPVPEEMIPMWLADMDFACPPGVIEHMKNRCDKEIFGYCSPMENSLKSVCFWQKERNNLEVNPKWISVIPTVVAGINVAIRTFTNEGDGIIIQQPVYDPFEKIVVRSGRTVVNNRLKSENNYYTMDYELLEKQAKDPNNKLMVLCSPHNPVGRVWKEEELRRVMDICIRNNVLVVVDEIHSDLIFYNNKFYSLLALDKSYADHVIMLTSPGKTFNVAGLKTAVSIIPDEAKKKEFDKMIVNMSLDIKNTFGVESLEACYTKENEQWLEELKNYIQGNIDFVYDFVKERMPIVKFCKPEGTYLIWLDFSDTNLSDGELLKDVVLGKAVICVPGTWFGPGGEGHIRFNAAGPRSMLKEALERFEEALKEKELL